MILRLASNSNGSGDLTAALPVGMLFCDLPVAWCWLDIAVPAYRTRRNRMRTGRGALPVDVPELPSELVLLTLVDSGYCPGASIESDFDSRDRCAPSRTANGVPAVL